MRKIMNNVLKCYSEVYKEYVRKREEGNENIMEQFYKLLGPGQEGFQQESKTYQRL